MPDNDHFEQVERHLYKLAGSIVARLGPASLRSAFGYIEVGEYGLALESMVHSIVESGLPLPGEDFNYILSLAKMMELPEEDFRSSLSALLEKRD